MAGAAGEREVVQSAEENDRGCAVRQGCRLPGRTHRHRRDTHRLDIHIPLHGFLLCLHAQHDLRQACQPTVQVGVLIFNFLFFILFYGIITFFC